MGLRSVNNPKASFEDPYLSTGKEAGSPNIKFQLASGGTKYTYGSYIIHKIDGSTPAPTRNLKNEGTLPITLEKVIVIGGGASGGPAGHGGGGGAGGVLTNIPGLMPGITPIPDLAVGATITITIGAGGASAAATGGPSSLHHPANITPTEPTGEIRANGGGYGAGLWQSGGSGGSGGGGAYAGGAGGATLPGPGTQGFPGGNGHPNAPYGGGGGGGGAGGAGSDSPMGGSNIGGKGGLGITLPTDFQDPTNPISPAGWKVAGGGGGNNSGNIGGNGGGGGGQPPGNTDYGAGKGSSPSPAQAGSPGIDNTGGGGGGGGPGAPFHAGGSGLVLIAYQPA